MLNIKNPCLTVLVVFCGVFDRIFCMNKKLWLILIVSALGYFVDVYDLILFGIVRTKSLNELGIDATTVGFTLLNYQLIGMLLGGFIWGILGDKIGREKVLFGSIITYSIANIANAFVYDVNTYAACRFVGGIGLAGELGVAITLISETMPKSFRGWASTIVVSFGVLGAVAAKFVAQYVGWRHSYFIGGLLGLLLLVLRMRGLESDMFHKNKDKFNLGVFLKKNTALKMLKCVFLGLPVWVSMTFIVMLAPELGKVKNITLNAGDAFMWYEIGVCVGGIIAGAIQQRLGARKLLISACLTFTAVLSFIILFFNYTSFVFYILSALLGVGCGFWVLFIAATSEQFGVNVRATATTTCPNFVRGLITPITFAFVYFKQFGFCFASALVVFSSIALAFIALFLLEETFGKDLDFVEE